MAKFVITLQEIMEKDIVVEGVDTPEEADMLVNAAYKKGDIILNADNSAVSVETIETTDAFDEYSMEGLMKLDSEGNIIKED